MRVFHFQGKILHVLILEEKMIQVQAGATAMIQVTVMRDFIFRCMERQNIITHQAVTADAGLIIFRKTRHGIVEPGIRNLWKRKVYGGISDCVTTRLYL